MGRRAQGEARGNRGRDRGRALREEEDGPDAWGRPVSGATRASGGAVGARWQAGPGECGVTRLSERAGGGSGTGRCELGRRSGCWAVAGKWTGERGERAGPREIRLGRWRARRERGEWAGERLGRAEGSG